MKTLQSVGILFLYDGSPSAKAVVGDVTSKSWSKPVKINCSENKAFIDLLFQRKTTFFDLTFSAIEIQHHVHL